jgi:hypothetical protein
MKKLQGSLVGTDGNAFALMGKFRAGARKAGWSPEEIQRVLADAMAGDYDQLLFVLSSQYEG